MPVVDQCVGLIVDTGHHLDVDTRLCNRIQEQGTGAQQEQILSKSFMLLCASRCPRPLPRTFYGSLLLLLPLLTTLGLVASDASLQLHRLPLSVGRNPFLWGDGFHTLRTSYTCTLEAQDFCTEARPLTGLCCQSQSYPAWTADGVVLGLYCAVTTLR